MKKFLKVFLAALLLASGFYSLDSRAATPEELRRALEQKAQILQQLNDQSRDIQKKLDATQNQKNSLQKEIKKIDYSVSQLNLGIKSGQINLEKLGLELDSLQYDISDLKSEISTKRLAIMKLVRELYEKERQGLLVAILKYKNLADSFLESQTIINLNSGLSIELTKLKELNQALEGKYRMTLGNKKDIETENRNLKNRRIIVEDQKSDRQNLLTQTKNQEKTFASLIDTLAKKQAEISTEIEVIEKELRARIDPSLLPIPRPGALAMPASGVLSQNYGETAFAKSGYRGKFHNGVDIAAPTGAIVQASEDGTVVATGNQDQYCYRGAYGKYIVIAHDNNLTTLYAHLSGQTVQKGDKITRGQIIGYVGSTGYATGPHLHFTVYAGPTFYMGASRVCGPMPFGGDLNPMQYL